MEIARNKLQNVVQNTFQKSSTNQRKTTEYCATSNTNRRNRGIKMLNLGSKECVGDSELLSNEKKSTTTANQTNNMAMITQNSHLQIIISHAILNPFVLLFYFLFIFIITDCTKFKSFFSYIAFIII